jgi:hypothetical protein
MFETNQSPRGNTDVRKETNPAFKMVQLLPQLPFTRPLANGMCDPFAGGQDFASGLEEREPGVRADGDITKKGERMGRNHGEGDGGGHVSSAPEVVVSM